MRQNRKLVVISLILLTVFLVLRRYDVHKVKEISNETLSQSESAAVIFDAGSGTIKIVTPRSGSGNGIRPPFLRRRFPQSPTVSGAVVKSIDGARGARISIDKRGNVNVIARTKGFLFEPGAVGVISDRPRAGFDIQWAFVRRWGVSTGIVTTRNLSIRGYIAGDYNFYGGSSLVVGMDSDKKFLIGLKVRF